MAPLKLYWWNNRRNFGDRISADIVAHVSGRTVEWAPAEEADLFAIGSIFSFASKASSQFGDRKPWVWGTGLIGPMDTGFLQRLNIASVRGPLSEEILGIKPGGYGDPGLLMAEVLGEDIKREDKVAIVPHFRLLDRRRPEELAASLPNAEVLDPRDNDYLGIVRRIAACKLVVSSSLHGLIIADAFGVPSLWLDPHGNHPYARLKFYDYAASVGRALNTPMRLTDAAELLERDALPEISYGQGIKVAVKNLKDRFPSALRA
ncbi:MAG: polysaccharide pyruvyl transferase family protein [Paracoccaceae bacterium]|uniref:polysaccharide pyruvyl transferase family protein n=1 Tax=Sulfitobacter pontiacus TaxID=60137 RepID=UPI00328467FF